MRLLTLALLLLVGTGPLSTQTPTTLSDFNWSRADVAPFTSRPPFTGGLIFPLGAGFTLGYEGTDPVSVTLRTIGTATTEKITSSHYALEGKIKYHDIPAGSYLEMISYFPPDKPGDPEAIFYSRTLTESGPAAKMEGTSDGRDFLLAHETTDAGQKPNRLALNLYLAGGGAVEISDVQLVQYPEAIAGSTAPAPQITITLHTSPENKTLYSANGTDYSDLPALQNWLKTTYQTAPQTTLALQADDAVPTLDVATTVEAIDNAGFYSPPIAITPAAATLPSVDTSATTTTDTSAPSSGGIEEKSFMLGVAATILTLAIVGSFSFLIRRLKRRRREQELRRRASRE